MLKRSKVLHQPPKQPNALFMIRIIFCSVLFNKELIARNKIHKLEDSKENQNVISDDVVFGLHNLQHSLTTTLGQPTSPHTLHSR